MKKKKLEQIKELLGNFSILFSQLFRLCLKFSIQNAIEMKLMVFR